MELAIQVCAAVVGVVLDILVISALLRGAYRRFPILLLYIVANLLVTVIETRLLLAVHSGVAGAIYSFQWYYWRDEAALQLLLFAVVITLIYYATERPRTRRMVLVGLVPAAALFVSVSFFVHYKPVASGWIGVWMTPWMRDVYVVSTVLDLALWAILIAAKKKNYQLLMLSGGLGIQFTGEAIGESVRNMAARSFPNTHGAQIPGDVVIMLANLTAMYIWWRAFQPQRNEPPVTRAARESQI